MVTLHSAISTVRSTKVQPNAGGLVVVLMELSADELPAAFRVVESVHRQIF